MLIGGVLRQLASRPLCIGARREAAQAGAQTISHRASATSHSRRHQSTTSKTVEPANSVTPPDALTTQPDELKEMRPARPLFYHDQMEWLDDRLVRISRPSKNVMQSGTAYTNCWTVEFDSQPRDEEWLMGWTGTKDPMSNMSLEFPTKEAAISFCERNKFHWFLEEQPERRIRKKSYADNFSWDKRTRLGSK